MSEEEIIKYAKIFSTAKGDTFKLHFGDKIINEPDVWKGVLNYIEKLQKENTELKEENQRIKDINVELNTDTSAWKTTAKELEEENQELEKVIDLMAEEIAENTGSCPLDIYNWENKKYDNCNNCNNTYKECFIEYFYKKAEELKE